MMPSTFNIFAVASAAIMMCNPLGAFAAVIGERSADPALAGRAVSSVGPPTTQTAFIKTVLAKANAYRVQHSAVPFAWSPTQAVFAQTQADKCELKHSGGPYGENIYWISSSSVDFNQQTNASFDGWMSEQPLYESDFMSALHYSQHIWKGSKRIGCAWSKACTNSQGGFYFFCEYSPAGNVLGQFSTNVS